MSRGDKYAAAMEEILAYIYEEGAIGGEQTVHLETIGEKFGVGGVEALSVMKLLEEQGKVAKVVNKVYRLTGAGFEEAKRLFKSKGVTWLRPAAE